MMHRVEEVDSCCFQSIVSFVCEERLGKPTTMFGLWLGFDSGTLRTRTNYRCLTPPSCTSNLADMGWYFSCVCCGKVLIVALVVEINRIL